MFEDNVLVNDNRDSGNEKNVIDYGSTNRDLHNWHFFSTWKNVIALSVI